jgi:hypothetical protein
MGNNKVLPQTREEFRQVLMDLRDSEAWGEICQEGDSDVIGLFNRLTEVLR